MPWSVEELTRWLDEVEPRMDALDPFGWLGLKPTARHGDLQPAFHAIARTRHPDLFRTRLSAPLQDRLVRAYARVAAAYAELRDPERFAEVARALRGDRGRLSAASRPPSEPVPAAGRAPTAAAPMARTAGGPQVARTTTAPQVARTTTAPQVARTTSAPQVARTTTAPQVARTATPPPQVSRTTTGPQLAGTPAPGVAVAEPPIEPARAMSPRALTHYRRAEGALRVGDHATALLQLRMAVAADPSSPLLRAALHELVELMNRR